MTIINRTKGWDTKVNFIDEVNSIVIGYDMSQQCCEEATWSIDPPLSQVELERYTIDSTKPIVLKRYKDFDYDNEVRFPLRHGRHKAYLVLRNVHNGYYTHDYTVEKEEELIYKGEL